MRWRGIGAIISIAIVIAALALPSSADTADGQWVFSQANNYLGWNPLLSPNFSSAGVVAGYLWGITSGTDPFIKGPGNLTIAARTDHYISFRMRMRKTTSATDRFGSSGAEIYWETVAEPSTDETKKVAFKTYGNGEWKTYNVRVGNHAKWAGTIKRLRIDPCVISGARVEIAWIKVMRDTTAPSCSVENMWTYSDGETTNDNTPTLCLRNAYDEVSGIDKVEFYWRPGASTSESDWVLNGIDSGSSDGYQYSYPQLPDGVYDLGAKVYDNSGNVCYWASGNDKWIDDLHVDSAMGTHIDVDAAATGDAVVKEIFGSNLMWSQWNSNYNAATGRLPEALESKIEGMGLPVLRYPGGCHADTFYWKQSIGPVACRPNQYTNGCNTTISTPGVAKMGLDEFLRFCEARGAKPMFTCRFRWPNSPRAGNGTITLDAPDPYAEALQDAIDLVEYCNSPNDSSNPNGGTDWAATRAANGHAAPYNVKYFEIGNEPWGPDPWGSPGNYGLDGPSEYAVAFLKYLEGMKAVDPTIKVSATTHIQSQLDFDPASPEWTYTVYQIAGPFIDRAQAHPYLPYSGWQTDKVKLYDETMATPKALDDVLATQRTTIKLTTPEMEGQIKLRLTEWNINYNWFYDVSQGRINTYHTKTLKAAIALADAFRVFIENRDIVESAEWWHLYSSTWSCIDSDATYKANPAYHTFRIFNKHFGDNLIKSKVFGSPKFDYIQSGGVLKNQLGLDYLTAIASRSADGKSLYLVVINKDRLDTHMSQINLANFASLAGVKLQAEIWELNGLDVDDYNNPQNTKITESSAVFDPSFNYTFPAHSVTSFEFVPIVSGPIATAKEAINGSLVELTNREVTAVFGSDMFYIEEDSRSSGMKVKTSGLVPAVGARVTVRGTIENSADGERFIQSASVVAVS